MSTVQITLSKRIKSFREADTSSTSSGFIEPGSYEVLERKVDYPSSDTDYSQLLVPNLGKVWICNRWKNNNYGEFVSGPMPVNNVGLDAIKNSVPKPKEESDTSNQSTPIISILNFDDKDDAIEESELISELAYYDGFSYDLHKPTYPYELKGINVPQGPPHQNNCCTFVEGMLVKAWADNFPNFDWNNGKHGQMMIFSTDDYFSPVTAVVESGMGEEVKDVDLTPQPWTVVQGWKKQWSGGHTFVIVDHHPETDSVLTLESNSAFKLNGVGFRGIGMASDFGHRPPEKWWEREGVWTWEKIKKVYQFRAMATLKVKNRKWSGVDV